MSRKPKGPTPEELIQKLQVYVDECKENNEKNIESIKSENEASLQVIQENIENAKNALSSLSEESNGKNIEHEKKLENIEENLLNNDLINTERSEKILNLEKSLDETKISNENINKNVQSQIDKTNAIVANTIEEMKKNINDQIENIMAMITKERENTNAKVEDMKAETSEAARQVQINIDHAIENLTEKIKQETNVSENTKGDMDMEMISFRKQVDALIARVDDVNEKMYEFEQNKRNNLLFYGIPNDTRETPEALLQKISSILKTTLCVSRDIPVLKASRVLIGPDVSGSRPVVVTFENYKDKEDVLRKGGMMKGSKIHVTEDMNKKTRDSRVELRRFMRAVKRNNPGASCVLHYDKLYVDNKVFVYNDVQGKVIEQTHEEQANGIFPLPSHRPSSSMTDNGSTSPVSLYRDKGLKRTQSMFSMGEEDVDNLVREKDDTIIELKNIIRKMEEDMKKLKNGINGDGITHVIGIKGDIGSGNQIEHGVAHANGIKNGVTDYNGVGNGVPHDNGIEDGFADGNEIEDGVAHGNGIEDGVAYRYGNEDSVVDGNGIKDGDIHGNGIEDQII
jgi:phage shock protein A